MIRGEDLHIVYKNKKLEKQCTNASEAEKKHGSQMAEKIHQRIDQIKAAESVELLLQFKIGGCHLLKGKRKDQYAMYLIHPHRLVFKKHGSDDSVVCIIEIIDYH